MFTAVRTMLLGLVVVAALVLGVASAGAGPNLVLNPGFETACGSVPCNWAPAGAAGSSSIVRDTVNPHSGSASLAATASGTATDFGARSDCFSISPSTAETVDGSYRTTSTALTDVRLVLNQYSDASCSTFVTFGLVAATPPVTTGAWTFLQGQVTTNANAHSARLAVGATCPSTCPGGTTANFDAVGAGTPPLAVTLYSFTGIQSRHGVILRWRTGSEVGALGFNVYRLRNGHRVRLNGRLIPALSLTRGGVSGAAYSYLDRRAPKHAALRYWLREVDTSGHRTWHGPVHVGPS